MEIQQKPGLKKLITKWNNPMFKIENPRSYEKTTRSLSRFFETDPNLFTLENLLEFLNKGGTNGRLYQFALSNLLCRNLSPEEIIKVMLHNVHWGAMSLGHKQAVFAEFLKRSKPKLEELRDIFVKFGPSTTAKDEAVWDNINKISKDLLHKLFRAVREQCGSNMHNELCISLQNGKKPAIQYLPRISNSTALEMVSKKEGGAKKDACNYSQSDLKNLIHNLPQIHTDKWRDNAVKQKEFKNFRATLLKILKQQPELFTFQDLLHVIAICGSQTELFQHAVSLAGERKLNCKEIGSILFEMLLHSKPNMSAKLLLKSYLENSKPPLEEIIKLFKNLGLTGPLQTFLDKRNQYLFAAVREYLAPEQYRPFRKTLTKSGRGMGMRYEWYRCLHCKKLSSKFNCQQ